MATATTPRILLCAADPAAVRDVRQLLEQAGYAVGEHACGGAGPEDLSAYSLVVLAGGRGDGQALQCCRHLRARLADGLVPILFLTEDTSPPARLAGLEAGADSYLLRPFAADELLAQVRAFLRIKDSHDRLGEKAAEVHRINKRLQLAYQQIDQELVLARRIQRSFLPQSLPEVPRVRFAVHYRPCGRVGGDFYDIFRLDESHLGFYVADAMGHGVPASLLTIFIKKAVRAKEIVGQQYRLVPPGEVLRHLNRDMIEQALSESPFITMVYVLFNHQDGTLRFSRSGHPYPLYLPRHGDPQLWQIEGTLLGVFDAEFPVQTHALQPGDKLLLYTDGVDAAAVEGQPPGVPSLLACAARLRELPIQELVDRLAQEMFGPAGQADDLTLLGLEMTG
jgi:sigma-B regulation protein RsbU (phosphoserine phosphatase)